MAVPATLSLKFFSAEGTLTSSKDIRISVPESHPGFSSTELLDKDGNIVHISTITKEGYIPV